MKTFLFQKLVRDKIPEHMKTDGQVIDGLMELDDPEFILELQKKVLEEAKELASVKEVEDIKEELADLREVLDYLQKALEMSENDLKARQQRKIAKNGAFDKRWYIHSVSAEEGTQWYNYYRKNNDKYPEVV